MNCGHRVLLVIAGFTMPIVTFGLLYAAQNGSAREVVPQPVYHTLFPKPTGKNGYEEFVRAEDLFTSSPVFLASERLYGEQKSNTIDAKRKLLANSTSLQVLTVLRSGLKKRIHSPRPAPELYTLIPELRDFRAMARLMCAEMDVLFADGKTSEAIDCLNDALKFGRDVQVGTLMSGVVGLYIENTALQNFTGYLDMLTVSDCDKLARVTRHHLERSNPQIALLTAERDMFLRTLNTNRNDACALLDKLDPGPNTPKSVRQDFTQVCRLAKDDPNAGALILHRAAELVRAHFERIHQEVKRPVWERTFQEPVERASLESKMIFSLFPSNYSQLSDRFASEQLRVQMLAVEAATVGYLRRSGHLPDSLAEMKLVNLTLDPFSGKQLGYVRRGIGAFTVSSVGPFDTGSSKHAATGRRMPVILAFPPQR